jgi:hypothetical protein
MQEMEETGVLALWIRLQRCRFPWTMQKRAV